MAGKSRSIKFILVLLLLVVAVGVGIYYIWWHNQPQPGHVKDEAKIAGREPDSFPAANEDFFHDMDQTKDGVLDLVAAARQMKVPDDTLIKGRNTWMVWSAGNDKLWDTLIYKSAGALDFLKILSSHPELLKIDPKFSRDGRWEYLGLVNDPCFEKATGPDKEHWGLWLDKRRADCKPDPFEDEQKYPGVKIGSRGTTVNGTAVPVGSFYGYETGIVGLRLFPNPDFDDAAAKKWDANRYYTDPTYYNDKSLVRPYRVGMSCAFCHVGPNPIKPPADPENPKWENLSANVGAQYFWIERIFYWAGEKDNFAWQLFHTSRPGTLDTSLVSTDNINNPRTMNALYLVKERLEEARRWGKETLGGGEKDNKQFNDYISDDPSNPAYFLRNYYKGPDTVWTPRVLKDGADSVGALGALNRVYLNIGTFSEEWLLHFNALVGGKPISPIEISVARKNSSYFAATENQTPFTALYFLASTAPHHLKDAPDGAKYLKDPPDVVEKGKVVFAEQCARCHSSKRPDPPVPGLDPNGCNGSDYLKCWNQYWEWTNTDDFKQKMKKIVLAPDFLDNNYLSSELRVPVTLLQTNACSPLATNALGGNIWDNFSSQSYKELPSVGTITWYQPYSGEARTYQMPAGGRGFTRPPSLVSLWSTAPFLLNNSVGKFNYSPSVDARMDSFQNSIEQMLWPEKREKDPRVGDKIPGPSRIDRTTETSYLKIAIGYLPEPLQPVAKQYPDLLDEKKENLVIGPIPKGTPIGLLANINPLSESKDPAERLAHGKKLLDLVIKLGRDLHKLPKGASDADAEAVFSNALEQMLELSKCPDLIVNRGHYFGTDMFMKGQSGLSKEEKQALIAFLKTF
jgi:hypothetical protein